MIIKEKSDNFFIQLIDWLIDWLIVFFLHQVNSISVIIMSRTTLPVINHASQKSVTGMCESLNLHRKNVYNGLGRKYVLWTDHQRQLHINCCSLEVLQVIFSCKICSNLYTWYTHLCPVVSPSYACD